MVPPSAGGRSSLSRLGRAVQSSGGRGNDGDETTVREEHSGASRAEPHAREGQKALGFYVRRRAKSCVCRRAAPLRTQGPSFLRTQAYAHHDGPSRPLPPAGCASLNLQPAAASPARNEARWVSAWLGAPLGPPNDKAGDAPVRKRKLTKAARENPVAGCLHRMPAHDDRSPAEHGSLVPGDIRRDTVFHASQLRVSATA